MTEQNGSPELDGAVQGTHVTEEQGEGPVAAQAGLNDDLLVNDELALDFDDPDEGPEAQQKDTRLYIKVKNFNKFIDESLKGLAPPVALTWLVLFRFARGWRGSGLESHDCRAVGHERTPCRANDR